MSSNYGLNDTASSLDYPVHVCILGIWLEVLLAAFVVVVVETGCHYIAQTVFKSVANLSFPESWDYKFNHGALVCK